jgi:hypothetical protein
MDLVFILAHQVCVLMSESQNKYGQEIKEWRKIYYLQQIRRTLDFDPLLLSVKKE